MCVLARLLIFRLTFHLSGPVLSGLGSRTIFFVLTTFLLMYLSIGSVLERLVLKNAGDWTRQRLKRASGARVMFFLCLTLIGNDFVHGIEHWECVRTLSFEKICRLH